MGKNTLVVRDIGDRAKLVVPENCKVSKSVENGTSVDSPAWLDYISSGLITSFRFEPQDSNLPSYLVRREARRSGSEFWYAFKQTETGLSKKYIGHTRALSYDKLLAIACDYAGLVPIPRKHYLDDLIRPDEFKALDEAHKDVWQRIDELTAENEQLRKKHSKTQMELARTVVKLAKAQEDIATRKKIHEMYKLTRMDNLVKLEQIITQWSQVAEGKRAKYDRSWGKALNLLRELNEALTLDLSGNAGEQPVAGGSN